MSLTEDEEKLVAFYSHYQPYGSSPYVGYLDTARQSTSSANRFNRAATVPQPLSNPYGANMRDWVKFIIDAGDSNPFMLLPKSTLNRATFNGWNDYSEKKVLYDYARFSFLPSSGVTSSDGMIIAQHRNDIVTIPTTTASGQAVALKRYLLSEDHVEVNMDMGGNTTSTFTVRNIDITRQYLFTPSPTNARAILVYDLTAGAPTTPTLTLTDSAINADIYYMQSARNGATDIGILVTFSSSSNIVWGNWTPGNPTATWGTYTGFDYPPPKIGLGDYGYVYGQVDDGSVANRINIERFSLLDQSVGSAGNFDKTQYSLRFDPQHSMLSLLGSRCAGVREPGGANVPTTFVFGFSFWNSGDVPRAASDAHIYFSEPGYDNTRLAIGSVSSSGVGQIDVYKNAPLGPLPPIEFSYQYGALDNMTSMAWLTNNDDTGGIPFCAVGSPSGTSSVYTGINGPDAKNPLWALQAPTSTRELRLYNNGSVYDINLDDDSVLGSTAPDNTITNFQPALEPYTVMNFTTVSEDQVWWSPSGQYVVTYTSSSGLYELRFTPLNAWSAVDWINNDINPDPQRLSQLVECMNTLCVQIDNSWAPCKCFENTQIVEAVFGTPPPPPLAAEYTNTAPCLWGACDDFAPVTPATDSGSVLQAQLSASIGACTTPTDLCPDDVEAKITDLSSRVVLTDTACAESPVLCGGVQCDPTQTCINNVCTRQCTQDADCPSGQACIVGVCATACADNSGCSGGLVCGSAGTCTGCTVTSQCDNGLVCSSGRCVSQSDDNDDNTWLIVGISIGVVAALLLLGLGILFGLYEQNADGKWVRKTVEAEQPSPDGDNAE